MWTGVEMAGGRLVSYRPPKDSMGRRGDRPGRVEGRARGEEVARAIIPPLHRWQWGWGWHTGQGAGGRQEGQ